MTLPYTENFLVKLKYFNARQMKTSLRHYLKMNYRKLVNCHLHVRIPSTENMMKPSDSGGKKVGV